MCGLKDNKDFCSADPLAGLCMPAQLNPVILTAKISSHQNAGLAEWFRFQPSKLIRRVRFSRPAPISTQKNDPAAFLRQASLGGDVSPEITLSSVGLRVNKQGGKLW